MPDDDGDNFDFRLMQAVAAGSTAAKSELVRRFQNRLHAYFWSWVKNRHDAEDLVQETMLHLLRSASCFHPELGRLEAWIFMIAKRRMIDWMRKGAGRNTYSDVNVA